MTSAIAADLAIIVIGSSDSYCVTDGQRIIQISSKMFIHTLHQLGKFTTSLEH